MEVDVIGWNNLRPSSTWLTMAAGSLDYSGDPSKLANQTLTGGQTDPREDDASSANTIAMSGSGSGGMIENYSLTETILISAALLFIIVGTVVGNILVCVAVCLVRRLRRPCNYLLVSLAVSDLCVALLVMPMALVYEVLGTWPFGASACDTWVAFDVLSCTASILNLCMISVDRYWAITRPLDYGVKRTPARMISCVALVWISSACISLPPLLVLGNEHGPSSSSPPSSFPPPSTTTNILPSNNNHNNNSNSQHMSQMTSSNGPLANLIEFATAAGQDYQCQVCQEFGYQIYATLGSFYIPLAVMAAVYYQIFQAAKRIVDEEKKAQSHLLMTRTNSCAKQKAAAAAAAAVGAGQPPVQSSLLVHPLHQPSLCTSAAMVVVRRHSDRQLDDQGNNIDANNSTLPGTNNSASPGLSNNDRRSSSWTNNCNGSLRPNTWPDNHPKQPQQQSLQTVDISRHSLAVSTDNVKEETATPVVLNHQMDPLSFQQKSHPGLVQSGSSPLPISSRRNRSHRLTHRRASRVRLRFALNKERKASTTLGIIMSAFTLCWFPFFVLALVRPFMSHQTASLVIPRWLSSLFLWLGYANSFLNPVIYATTNKDFRLPFREILCLRCKSLNSVMREDFYQSQYGNNQQLANNNKAGLMLGGAQLMAAGSVPTAASSPSLKPHHRSRCRNRRHSSDSLCGQPNYRGQSPTTSSKIEAATADEEDTTDYGLMSSVHRVSSSSATAFL